MIIQTLLNWLRDLVASWIAAFPDLPETFYDAWGWLNSGGAWLNDQVSIYGAVIPFNTINGLLAAWLGVLTFWVVCLVIRVVLWAFNR